MGDPLNIDDCWDAGSINAKIDSLQRLVDYGNDLAPQAHSLIKTLEERKEKLS